MALAKEVREAVVAKLADENNGLNPQFVSLCREYEIPVLAPGMGATPDAPFDFSPGSAQFFQTDIDINQLEKYSNLQYPCVLLSTPTTREAQQNKITPSVFSGFITVDLKVYLSWATQEPPPGNNYEIYMDTVQRAVYRIFNGSYRHLSNESQWWGAGIAYGGDISELPRDRMVLHNGDLNWRRGCHFQISFFAVEQ